MGCMYLNFNHSVSITSLYMKMHHIHNSNNDHNTDIISIHLTLWRSCLQNFSYRYFVGVLSDD